MNSDGIDKVIALDVLARFVIVEELAPFFNQGARVMSVLGSTARAPPPPSVENMQKLMTGEKQSYNTPSMLATAGVSMDAWLQVAALQHKDVYFVGTFPGIVSTTLIVTSKTLPS